jgi:hypothetical protein
MRVNDDITVMGPVGSKRHPEAAAHTDQEQHNVNLDQL